MLLCCSAGLCGGEASERLREHGSNELSHLRPAHWSVRLFWCTVQPFNMVLAVLAALSAAPLPESDFVNVGVMLVSACGCGCACHLLSLQSALHWQLHAAWPQFESWNPLVS